MKELLDSMPVTFHIDSFKDTYDNIIDGYLGFLKFKSTFDEDEKPEDV